MTDVGTAPRYDYLEEVDIGVAIVSSSVTIITYSTYVTIPEEIDIAVSLISGEVVYTGYKKYVIPVESIDVGAEIESASVEIITYIAYENYIPEEIDVGVAIVSGVVS